MSRIEKALSVLSGGGSFKYVIKGGVGKMKLFASDGSKVKGVGYSEWLLLKVGGKLKKVGGSKLHYSLAEAW